jgi:hypothetical protein
LGFFQRAEFCLQNGFSIFYFLFLFLTVIKNIFKNILPSIKLITNISPIVDAMISISVEGKPTVIVRYVCVDLGIIEF